MTITIEKNVDLIGRCGGTGDATRKYPFNEMEVGDSFLINGLDPKAVSNAAWQYGKRVGKTFTVRKTPEGPRCWRVR